MSPPTRRRRRTTGASPEHSPESEVGSLDSAKQNDTAEVCADGVTCDRWAAFAFTNMARSFPEVLV
jgi:hypothetical protein